MNNETQPPEPKRELTAEELQVWRSLVGLVKAVAKMQGRRIEIADLDNDLLIQKARAKM